MIELLSPAGNLEKLKIGFLYGADAAYLAGQKFGLRSAAGNFTNADITEAAEFAHSRGKKIYITLNAFLHDDELKELPEFTKFLEKAKVDAVICSDMGVAKTVRDSSNLAIHISTQASIINSEHALLWKKELGVTRVVVGREMSLEAAAKLKKDTALEVEMFIHGAMCMSYSGHCSMSNYVAGRDSNRGGCIQNCRFNYNLYLDQQKPRKNFFLSSKDLSALPMLSDFIEAGIDSLKIEGRMKSNLYIATTTHAYAQALKELKAGKKEISSELFTELTRIKHRDYTLGSLGKPADETSIYLSQERNNTDYDYAGTVLEVNQKENSFAFFTRNKLTKGSLIEVIPFNGETIEVKTDSMKNVSGQELDVAQANTVIWLPLHKNIQSKNVARFNSKYLGS